MRILIFMVFLVSTFGTFKMFSEGIAITSPQPREVTLVDTSVSQTYHVSRKGDRTYNDLNQWIVTVKGHFIDKKTGISFVMPIRDKLYYEFKNSVGKPIPLTLNLRADLLDGNKLGMIAWFFGYLLLFFSGVSLLAFFIYPKVYERVSYNIKDTIVRFGKAATLKPTDH